MDEFARKRVQTALDNGEFSENLAKWRGNESWMAVEHRLHGHRKLIEEAMAAAAVENLMFFSSTPTEGADNNA